MLRGTAVLAGLFVAISTANAAEIRCLCPGAMRALLGELGPQFEQASGHKLTIEFALLGVIADRAAKGEVADVAIVSPRQAEELEKRGRLVTGSCVELGRVGYGAVVRKGAPKPDISSVEALKRTLLNAKSISYGDPAGGGPGGIYVAGLLERLGLASQLKAKIKLTQSAAAVIPAVATGDVEIGFTIASAIEPTVEFIPLPAEVQDYTVYMAGVMASSKEIGAARALINFLLSAAAKDAMSAKGFEPR